MKVNVGVVDDHQLFLKSLTMLIKSFPDFYVGIEALNGLDLMTKLKSNQAQPDILLLDVNMTVMDGAATAEYISTNYPLIKTVALSIKDDDRSIISMLKAGCCAYLLKNIHPDEFEKALLEIYHKGYYNADAMNINYRRLLINKNEDGKLYFSEKELQFLKLAISDNTYKHIASEMNVSPRTVDGYRDDIFQKLNVQSRTGMILEAIRRKLVDFE